MLPILWDLLQMSPAPKTFLKLSHSVSFTPLELQNILFVPLILICLPLFFVFVSYFTLPFLQLDLNFLESWVYYTYFCIPQST